MSAKTEVCSGWFAPFAADKRFFLHTPPNPCHTSPMHEYINLTANNIASEHICCAI